MSRILLGVSAGIAIYKAADLASKLTQRGDEVRTLMTPNALEFMSPLTFRSVTRQPVYTSVFEEDPTSRPEHISLTEWAELMVIAPATADLIGQIAAGLGGNILTTALLACAKPVLIAPAMNDRMWANPLVRENVKKLRGVGYDVLDPESGHLACGSLGAGRLPECDTIIARIDLILERSR
jgi:phosphopantothenoylcysteine decarboxylase/phosphopantothenate--cysteine ligase